MLRPQCLEDLQIGSTWIYHSKSFTCTTQVKITSGDTSPEDHIPVIHFEYYTSLNKLPYSEGLYLDKAITTLIKYQGEDKELVTTVKGIIIQLKDSISAIELSSLLVFSLEHITHETI